jgi:hypothetical protein
VSFCSLSPIFADNCLLNCSFLKSIFLFYFYFEKRTFLLCNSTSLIQSPWQKKRILLKFSIWDVLDILFHSFYTINSSYSKLVRLVMRTLLCQVFLSYRTHTSFHYKMKLCWFWMYIIYPNDIAVEKQFDDLFHFEFLFEIDEHRWFVRCR